MQKDAKLKRTMKRVGQVLERSGFRISFCVGILSQSFSLTADSIYSLNKDAGAYIKIAIDAIPKEQLDIILNYPTSRKKEIWILKKDGKSSSDPGTFLVYRIDGRELIEHPRNWPISKVVSSPRKQQATCQK